MMIGGVLFLHFCSQCGHEIPHREKFCQNCGTKIEYLCALPPLPPDHAKRREVRAAASISKWIVLYVIAIFFTYTLSFLYFSSNDMNSFFSWAWPFGKQNSAASQTVPLQNPPVQTDNSASTLKNSFNQLSIAIQKTSVLYDESRKVNVAGDPKRTAANYRVVQRGCDTLLGKLSMPPGASADIAAVAMPLKESLSLLSKSTSIMADYLEGKLSLAPPNPDWVGRAQENSAQSQARLKEAQQALMNLRKKID